MEQSLWFEEAIERMKEKLFSPSADLYAFVPVSAYETAWVAMVPDPDDPTHPMFPEYLTWILRNQNDLGFWFDQQHGINIDYHEHINYKHQWSNDDLLATLACLIALKTWDSIGFSHKINKGLKFLQGCMEKELINMRNSNDDGDEAGHALLHRWFLMAKLAKAKGLKVFPTEQSNNGVFYDFQLNGIKLEKEEADERVLMREIAFKNRSSALLCRSPSVTACAYMITGNQTYKTYLEHLLADCQHGVPPIYLEDKDVIKLCVVDHLERLGCAEHFSEEISNVMDHLHRKWIAEESKVPQKDDDAFQIYKDSLAFRLLRMHGYQVSPRRFCWFIDDEKNLSYMKDNYAFFLSPMLSIYKASHIAFPEDYELDKAGAFSRQILQMGILSMKSENESNTLARSTKFEQEIEHELGLKWLARMDHLEHRLYIERGGIYHFWIGKNAPCCILRNDDLLQLATNNFMMRQLVYRKELNELHRWSKHTGLFTMGFGREKTTYCYFAIASAICLPLNTESRKEAAKCATFFTVADDFFDEKGSLHDLSILTDSLQRWEGKALTSHSKIIFTVLNDLVHDISVKSFKQHGHNVKKILQDAWKDIFISWLKEVEWSKNSHYPSIDEYIENAKTSVAVEMILLPKCYLTKPKVSLQESSWNFRSAIITKSLEVLCRLLNDLESYEREAKAGEPNIVLLHLMQNPKAKIDDVVAIIKNTLKMKEKEFLQLVMSKDSESDMPTEWKMMHLSCLKIFQMFYNSENSFDSPTALLDNINKAIYEPLLVKKTISQPADFIIKELKKINTKAPYTKVKLSRASNKHTLLSIDSNKWLYPRAKKQFHKLSFACSFRAYNTAINKCLL
ncbi:S-linalool synthase [Dendrobium catenatum]|uniref:S-linalool synthase n=1 Tax=Dendrobium catenatum TaxID=906689 RepID=A0A2I0VLH6_9ASPA|nr:S-linalool synthase [Dendrobium catenatum]PKU64265.1 S-linalool synthase [Dendrobium catenatum]